MGKRETVALSNTKVAFRKALVKDMAKLKDIYYIVSHFCYIFPINFIHQRQEI